MKQTENGKIIRLIATIEKDLSDLETLKDEVDEIDIHNTHPRILLPLNLFERYFSTLFDQIFSDISHWMRTLSRVGVSTMLLFC